jgi:PhnB protein
MVPPGAEDKVMHASLRIGDSVVMASDDCRAEAPPMSGFSLSISVADAAEARRCFDALAEGGSVQMPLGRTFWSPCFGMLTDRFGVGWMISALA